MVGKIKAAARTVVASFQSAAVVQHFAEAHDYAGAARGTHRYHRTPGHILRKVEKECLLRFDHRRFTAFAALFGYRTYLAEIRTVFKCAAVYHAGNRLKVEIFPCSYRRAYRIFRFALDVRDYFGV